MSTEDLTFLLVALTTILLALHTIAETWGGH